MLLQIVTIKCAFLFKHKQATYNYKYVTVNILIVGVGLAFTGTQSDISWQLLPFCIPQAGDSLA